MRNRPNGADLLAIARQTFLSEVMPRLPEEERYTALMVANAMANAEREAAAGDVPLRAELDRLRAIYPSAPASDDPVTVQLNRFNRQLAVDLRKGTHEADRARREQVRTHLVLTAMERVRESNPKYLQREGLE
jgi:hypothetical protein